MRIPVIKGMIERRILVNYRVDPAVLADLVPAPFRPKLVNGMGMAGICLIRLAQLRPGTLPSPAGLVGIASENAAHRIAVEWDEPGMFGEPAERREGVYIPRRDTSSWPTILVGGRLFPGVHHHARFRVAESASTYRVQLDSDDGTTHLLIEAHRVPDLPATSIFSSTDEASAFFARGSVGYSPATRSGAFDGLELRTLRWQVEPLAVTHVESSFFADRALFPTDSAAFDSALLMRHIAHEWHAHPCLCDTSPDAPERDELRQPVVRL
jgi:hypothetical protein